MPLASMESVTAAVWISFRTDVASTFYNRFILIHVGGDPGVEALLEGLLLVAWSRIRSNYWEGGMSLLKVGGQGLCTEHI